MRNRAAKSSLRSALRKYREMNEKDKKDAMASLESMLDKAVLKGIIHRNTASRLKSRLHP